MGQHKGNDKKHGRRRWLGVMLWAIFGAGLLVQVLAPGLQIKNRAFVMPPSPGSRAEGSVSPADIVARERLMQSLAAILTLSGALGLAFHYRRAIVGYRSL